jgi:hypothetical protein
VWGKLTKQVTVELEQLKHLLEVHRSLLTKCIAEVPDAIEVSALAAMLHSFYTGVENIFKRVTVSSDEKLPKGEMWHRQLLDAMTQLAAMRKAAISESLRQTLRAYLDFRHTFRQAYSFELK